MEGYWILEDDDAPVVKGGQRHPGSGLGTGAEEPREARPPTPEVQFFTDDDDGIDLHRPEVHLCAVEPRRAADGSGSRTVQNGPLSKVSSP